jgi:hypothetical protein
MISLFDKDVYYFHEPTSSGEFKIVCKEGLEVGSEIQGNKKTIWLVTKIISKEISTGVFKERNLFTYILIVEVKK